MADVLISQNVLRMTSLQIAEVTGKNHFDVLRAIRKMEPAWEKITESKFTLSEYKDSTGRKLPCYSLTQEETLYIATKFNDEARAKLVRRWKELEFGERQRRQDITPIQALLASVQQLAELEQRQLQNENRTLALENKIENMERQREEATEQLMSTPYLSEEMTPKYSKRDMCRKLVNDYAVATGISQQDIWRNIYTQLYYLYKISVNSYTKKPKESKLDVCERIGCMDKIHAIVSSMVYEYKKNNIGKIETK